MYTYKNPYNRIATITFVTENCCPLMSSRDHGVQYAKCRSSKKPNKPR